MTTRSDLKRMREENDQKENILAAIFMVLTIIGFVVLLSAYQVAYGG